MQILDVVALVEDAPEHKLKRGQVGTIVAQWADDVYEVEFADEQGVAYAMAALRADQLMPLIWQPTPLQPA
jgi:hypothetical protein